VLQPGETAQHVLQPETAVALPAVMKSAFCTPTDARTRQQKPTRTMVTAPSWKKVVALPMTLGRTAMRSPLTAKSASNGEQDDVADDDQDREPSSAPSPMRAGTQNEG